MRRGERVGRAWAIAHFEYGEREALLLEEEDEQLDQVTEGDSGEVGQLPELVPEAELERHLVENKTKHEGVRENTWNDTEMSFHYKQQRVEGVLSSSSSLHVKGKHSRKAQARPLWWGQWLISFWYGAAAGVAAK